jgi:hypothetical protein
MKIHYHLSTILLLLVTGACHTNAPGVHATPAEEALLLEVSAADRSNIAEARSACDHANDVLAAAKADCAKASAAQATAGEALDAAVARVGYAERALSAATSSGSSTSVEDARRDVEVAKAEWRFQESSYVLRDKQASHANAMASLAAEQVKVAEAGVELAKVRAINSLDRPEVRKAPIGKFEAQVRLAESQENLASPSSAVRDDFRRSAARQPSNGAGAPLERACSANPVG